MCGEFTLTHGAFHTIHSLCMNAKTNLAWLINIYALATVARGFRNRGRAGRTARMSPNFRKYQRFPQMYC